MAEPAQGGDQQGKAAPGGGAMPGKMEPQPCSQTDTARKESKVKKGSSIAQVKQSELNLIVMAGPMRDTDPLYVVMLILGLLTTILSALGVFIPYWFKIVQSLQEEVKRLALFDVEKCRGGDPEVDSDLNICFGKERTLNCWVMAVQIMGPISVCLCCLNVAMQLVNLILRPRNSVLHYMSLSVMALAGAVMMFTGHIGHHVSVWMVLPSPSKDTHVFVEPIGSGFFLTGAVIAGWVCVLTHVSAHSPGPLSIETRFLHTLIKDTFVPPSEASLELQRMQLMQDTKDTSTDSEQARKASVISTSV